MSIAAGLALETRDAEDPLTTRGRRRTEKNLVPLEPVHQDRDVSPARRDQAFHRREAKALLPHLLQKDRGVLAAGIGQEGFTAGGEEAGDHGYQCRDVPGFVEHIGSEDEVEEAKLLRLGRVPVEESCFGLETQVGAGVVAGEVEGGRIMVGSGDPGSVSESDYAR